MLLHICFFHISVPDWEAWPLELRVLVIDSSGLATPPVIGDSCSIEVSFTGSASWASSVLLHFDSNQFFHFRDGNPSLPPIRGPWRQRHIWSATDRIQIRITVLYIIPCCMLHSDVGVGMRVWHPPRSATKWTFRYDLMNQEDAALTHDECRVQVEPFLCRSQSKSH